MRPVAGAPSPSEVGSPSKWDGLGELVDLSVIVPVYRSADTLRPLAGRLTEVLDRLVPSFEVVFVDDGSPDDSWRILCDLQRADPVHVVVVQLMRNFGQHNALMCGFRHARGRYLVTLDDDLQNPPEEIPKLLNAIRAAEFDLVYGSYRGKNHRAWRNLGSVLVNAFYRIVFRIPVTVTSFRIMRRELVESILPYALNFTYVDGLLAWSTQRVGSVPVDHHRRAQGRSGYSFWKLVGLATNLFANFSLLPLQLVTACGLLAAGGGLLLGLYYLVHYFTSSDRVPGYASTIIAVLVLGGAQLLSLGVLGEYLGRLHLNVNRKPQYVVRHLLATGRDDPEQGRGRPPAAERPTSASAS